VERARSGRAEVWTGRAEVWRGRAEVWSGSAERVRSGARSGAHRGSLEPRDDSSCVLRTGSDWLGGLAIYIAEIGVDFTVLEPPEFAERVRELAGRFARAAAG
jgi:hypothetical protein